MLDYNETLSNPRAAALKKFSRSHIMHRAWAIYRSVTFRGTFGKALKEAWAECASMVVRWAKADRKSTEIMKQVRSPDGQRNIRKAFGRDSYRYGMACMGR